MKTLKIYAELNARIPNAVRSSLADVTYVKIQDILISLVKINKIFLLQKVLKLKRRYINISIDYGRLRAGDAVLQFHY